MHNITPIICVGETWAQREAGQTETVNQRQTVAAYAGLKEADALKTVVAYEPVWAIGTGKTATAKDADTTIKYIRNVLAELYGDRTANQIRILYGGSMNAANAAELLAMPDIDGGLIGGASLKAADFGTIIKAAR